MRIYIAVVAVIVAVFSIYTWQRDPYEHRAFSCYGKIKSNLDDKVSENETVVSIKFSKTKPKFYWLKDQKEYYGKGGIIFYFSKIDEKNKIVFDEEILEIDSINADILRASSPTIYKNDPTSSLNYNIVGNDVSFNRYTKDISVYPKLFITARCQENTNTLYPLKYGIF